MKSNNNYKAWAINEKDYPGKGTIEEKIQFLIEYGILAPSTHNTQPWLFKYENNKLIILPDLGKKLSEADPSGRNLYISLGACVLNIKVAAAHFGLAAKENIVKQRNQFNIEIEFSDSKENDIELKKLFPAIRLRYSEKRTLNPLRLNEADWKAISINSQQKIRVSFNSNPSEVKELASIVFQSAASYADKPLFGRELSKWMRSNKTKNTLGMTGLPSGLTNGKVFVGKILMKNVPPSMKVFAKKYHEQSVKSSGLGVLSTEGDSQTEWIQSGMAYEEIALRAQQRSISLSPMAAVIETSYRNTIKKYFNNMNKKPQMFFRLIKVRTNTIHSPRQIQKLHISNNGLHNQINAKLNDSFIKIGNYDLHYVEAGETNKKSLILIHGANIGWGQWYPNIDELANKYHVFAIDLPGSGLSSRLDYKKADFYKDYVHAVIKFINGMEIAPVHIVGHSFGGAIAAKTALTKPNLIDKIVLVEPLGLTKKIPIKQKAISSQTVAKIIAKTVMKPTRKNLRSFLLSSVYNKSAINDDFVNYYYESVIKDKRSHPLLFMNGQTQGFKFNPLIIFIDELRSIKKPLLVVLGDKDPLLPTKNIAQLVREAGNAKLKVFKLSGHVPSLEQRDLFNKTLLNFLKAK